jgi:hypothetical protein
LFVLDDREGIHFVSIAEKTMVQTL